MLNSIVDNCEQRGQHNIVCSILFSTILQQLVVAYAIGAFAIAYAVRACAVACTPILIIDAYHSCLTNTLTVKCAGDK